MLSLLLAESHLTDPRTGQSSVIGIIDHLHGARYPVMMSRMCVFAEMTNGRGTVPVVMRVIDADEARPPVFTASVNVTFADPLAISQVACGAVGATFPEPGEYRVQILSGAAVLAERRLLMVLDQPAGPQQAGDRS
ncbi:MAG TPA: hypothetical protein VHC70_05920 [Phycisphaerales bacterium]|nr:hypothetical protein [Phycisphaerales bacterium]